MSQETIRVRAVEGALVQPLFDNGRVMRGAGWVGRDAEGNIIHEGVVLPKLPQWMRKIAHGDLELITEPVAPAQE